MIDTTRHTVTTKLGEISALVNGPRTLYIEIGLSCSEPTREPIEVNRVPISGTMHVDLDHLDRTRCYFTRADWRKEVSRAARTKLEAAILEALTLWAVENSDLFSAADLAQLTSKLAGKRSDAEKLQRELDATKAEIADLEAQVAARTK